MVTEVKHEEMDGTDLVEKKPKHSIGEKVRKVSDNVWFCVAAFSPRAVREGTNAHRFVPSTVVL